MKLSLEELLGKLTKEKDELHLISFSEPVNDKTYRNIRLRPILLKGVLFFQVNKFTKEQCFTSNIEEKELYAQLKELFLNFKTAFIRTRSIEYQIQFLEQDSYKLSEHNLKQEIPINLAHNKLKSHMLLENTPYDFFVALGVQTKEGRVVKEYAKKFKQVNSLLEHIVLSLPEKKDPLVIVDFGCGKGYLSFALHHYIQNVLLRPVILYGIDRKKEVIADLQAIVNKLSISGLHFIESDIQDIPIDKADVVIGLHACDTGSDIAIKQAVRLDAKALFISPCCHHEVASCINTNQFSILLKHDILKERFSEIYTDALRAHYLEKTGWNVSVVEFVHAEHTPRNLLIRATRTKELHPFISTPEFESLNETFSALPLCYN